jgi:hypothetical protein
MDDTLSRLSRHILSDQEALARLLALPDEESRAEEASRIGRNMGLAVTPQAAREYLARCMERELSDRELAAVAGGKGDGNTGGDTIIHF